MARILTRDEVQALQERATTNIVVNANKVLALAASHEALRARVEELEAWKCVHCERTERRVEELERDNARLTSELHEYAEALRGHG